MTEPEAGPGMQPTAVPVAAARPEPGSTAPQNAVIAVALALETALLVADALHNPQGVHGDHNVPVGCAFAVLGGLAQAFWITLDCRRRREEVGAWRFGAIAVGPLAIWIYLIVKYRLRALIWMPVSIAVYAAPMGAYVVTLSVVGTMR